MRKLITRSSTFGFATFFFNCGETGDGGGGGGGISFFRTVLLLI